MGEPPGSPFTFEPIPPEGPQRSPFDPLGGRDPRFPFGLRAEQDPEHQAREQGPGRRSRTRSRDLGHRRHSRSRSPRSSSRSRSHRSSSCSRRRSRSRSSSAKSPAELLSTDELRARLAERLGSVALPPGRLYAQPRPKPVFRPKAPLPVGRVSTYDSRPKAKAKAGPFSAINPPPPPCADRGGDPDILNIHGSTPYAMTAFHPLDTQISGEWYECSYTCRQTHAHTDLKPCIIFKVCSCV